MLKRTIMLFTWVFQKPASIRVKSLPKPDKHITIEYQTLLLSTMVMNLGIIRPNEAKIVDYWNRRMKETLSRAEWDEFFSLVSRFLKGTQLDAEYNDPVRRRDLINTFFTEKIFLNASTTRAQPINDANQLRSHLKHYATSEFREIARNIEFDDSSQYDLADSNEGSETDGADICEACQDGHGQSSHNEFQVLSEAGIDVEKTSASAIRFWEGLDHLERIYLASHTCSDIENREPISSIAERLAVGTSYHYKAKMLGITGDKAGFFKGYEKTKLGQWFISVGAKISHEWQREMLLLIVILCMHAHPNPEATA